jgi:phosphoenolpyruvate phosphomutase
VVVVPTNYFNTPAEVLADMGISLAIFANHNLRASMRAMQETSARIFKDKSLAGVEKEVRQLFYKTSYLEKLM